MKLQDSKNLLTLLQHVAAYDLTDYERRQAIKVLKLLPKNSSLLTITNKLKVFTNLTIFALLVEQSLQS